MRSTPRFLRLLSTAALSTSIILAPLTVRTHFDGVSVPAARAADTKKSVKLTATQLMAKMEQALVLISQRLKAVPSKDRSKAAPLVKALVEASKELKAVKKAAAAKDSKALAQALPKASEALARVENAYRLSGVKAKDVAVAVKSLGDLWQDYLKKSGGSKAGASKKNAVANAKRIKAMRKQLADLSAKRGKDALSAYEIAEMQRRLDLAERANRSMANQWLATILLAEILGIYTGYYDYIVIYHPDDLVYYTDSYTYFTAEVYYSYSEYSVYYESYDWVAYDTPIVVSDEYTFGMSSTEYASFETSYEASYESYESTTETSIVNQEEIQKIDAADEAVDAQAEKVDSAAEAADPEAEAVDVSDDEASPDTYLDDQDEATDDAAPADETAVEPTEAEPEATEEPAAEEQQSEEPQADDQATEEEPQADEQAPEEEPQADEQAPEDDTQADEAPADDEQADEVPPEDDQQADDDGSSDEQVEE